MHARSEGRREHRECPPLTVPQICAHLEDQVSRRQALPPREFGQDVARHDARAGTELEYLSVGNVRQDLRTLRSDAAAEQRRDFRRRHEISRDPKLRGASAVVTEAGLVQRHLHETLEADPARARIDCIANPMHEAFAVGAFVRRQGR